jgi:hypothetical protein
MSVVLRVHGDLVEVLLPCLGKWTLLCSLLNMYVSVGCFGNSVGLRAGSLLKLILPMSSRGLAFSVVRGVVPQQLAGGHQLNCREHLASLTRLSIWEAYR